MERIAGDPFSPRIASVKLRRLATMPTWISIRASCLQTNRLRFGVMKSHHFKETAVQTLDALYSLASLVAGDPF